MSDDTEGQHEFDQFEEDLCEWVITRMAEKKLGPGGVAAALTRMLSYLAVSGGLPKADVVEGFSDMYDRTLKSNTAPGKGRGFN